MKNPLLTFAMIASSLVCIAQNPVNFYQIERAIQDSSSEFYYPTLLERFENGDLNMTLEQKRHCYYGFVFDSNYDPYERPKGTDQVDTLLSKTSRVDMIGFQQILDSTLALFPFDLKTLAYRIRYASEEEKHRFKTRLNILYDAIRSTGDGASKNTPIQVIFLPHELLVTNMLNLERSGRQTLGKAGLDVIKLAKNEQKIKKLYFDVSRMNANGAPKNVLFHQFYHIYIDEHQSDYEVK